MIRVLNQKYYPQVTNRKNLWYTWLSSSVTIPITLFLIIIKSTLPLVELSWQFIILGIIAFSYGILTIFVYRWTNKTDKKPDLDKYSKHLRELMDSLKDNLTFIGNEPDLFNILSKEEPKKELKHEYPDYFTAIKKSPKKVALIQHLMTDIDNPADERPIMFLWFNVIQQNLKTLKENPHSGNLRVITDGAIPYFNRDFDHVFQSVHDGQPIFGACDGCIEFYSGRNYQKCRNVLDNTMSDRERWYYSLFD